MDKQKMLILGAAAVGAYMLFRWQNGSNPLTLPSLTGAGGLFPSFGAPTTPAQVNAQHAAPPLSGDKLGAGTPFGMVGSFTPTVTRTAYTGPVLTDAQAEANMSSQQNYLFWRRTWGEVGGNSNDAQPGWDGATDWAAKARERRGRSL